MWIELRRRVREGVETIQAGGGALAAGLRGRYPATAEVFTRLRDEEVVHRRRLTELSRQRFGEHIPPMRRVVAAELAAISHIRHRYMDTPLLSAAFQVLVGRVPVFLTGVFIGSS